MQLKKPTIFKTIFCLVVLFAFTGSLLAQVPAGGATDVALNTTYAVPSGLAGAPLTDGVAYDLYVLNAAGNAIVGTKFDFTYSNASGNTGPNVTLINYQDYQWGVWADGVDPLSNAALYGTFAFTTIGPTVSLTGGGGTISENGGTAVLTATASAAIGKNLNVTVTYTGTTDPVYGTDFTNTGGADPEIITITAGTLTKTTTITGVGDLVLEGNETVIGTITTLASGVIGGSAQTITLTDDFLTAPINGLTGVPIEPTFTWKAVTSGGTYKIQITTTSGDYSSPIEVTLVDGILTYQAKETDTGIPLSNNTTYYWRITDGVLNSNEWQFQTVPSVSITLGNPPSGIIVYTLQNTFTWVLGAGGTGGMQSKIQVLASATTPTPSEWTSPTFTATTSSTLQNFTLIGGTKYYWRIVLLNSGNEVIGYSSVANFTTSGGASVTVTPSYPIGGSTTYTNPPSLYWYLNEYAPGVTFVVRYSTSSTVDGNGALSVSPDSLAPTSSLFATITSVLSSGTTYYWQVSARVGATVGTWTTPVSFKTQGSGVLATPIPSYPIGGVTVYTVSPKLYWYLPSSTVGLTYEIDYGTTVDGTADVTGLTDLFYVLSGLTPGTNYQWRVRSNNGTPGSWSTTQSFTVSGGVTSSFTITTWPVGNPTVYTQKPTLNWYLSGSSLGLTGYKVKYSTTNPGSSSAWDALDGTLGAPDATDGEVTVAGSGVTEWTHTFDLTYGQQYYWAVAPWDGSSAGFYASGSFTIAGGPSSGVVVLNNPIGGVTVNTKSPVLAWNFTGSTIGLVGYEVQYSDNGGLTSWTTVSSALSSTSTTASLSGLTAGATYTWKVRAYFGGSTYGTSSGTTTFVVDPSALTIVPIVGGPDKVTINTSNADVTWVIPTATKGNLNYELVIGDNEALQNAQTITSPDPFTEVSSLESNKSYYWKVRSVADDGSFSNYSNMGNFNTADEITDIDNSQGNIPSEYKLSQNYPNPFNPSTIIKYSLPEASFVSLKIYNILGKEVRTLVNNEQNVGNYQEVWNGLDNAGKRVATGLYIYRITTGKFVAAKKMLLLK